VPDPANIRGQFEALLLAPMLAPFEDAFGEYGALAAPAFSAALAQCLELHDERR
jgi:hypothetical protein